jgi:hypothetical protein
VNQNDALAGAMVVFLGFMCLIVIVIIVIAVFYLLTLQKALSRVARRNRLMEPGMVWLSLIPIFNIYWSFMIATRIPDSLRNEFRDRGEDDGSDYGKTVGLSNAIIGVVSIPFSMLSNIEHLRWVGIIQLPLALASLVLFIIFWVKIAGYSGRLAAPPRYSEGGPDYPDDGGDEDFDHGPRGPSSDAIRPADPGAIRP